MFGATGSVYSFNRISRAVAHIARKHLFIPCDSYYDDFWALELAETAQSGWAAFRALVEILGGRVKDEKAVAPTEQGDLLGADVEVAGDPLVLRSKDERRAKIAARIDEALRTDQLSPADAGSLAGTCTFMSTTTFGKVGRKDASTSGSIRRADPTS